MYARYSDINRIFSVNLRNVIVEHLDDPHSKEPYLDAFSVYNVAYFEIYSEYKKKLDLKLVRRAQIHRRPDVQKRSGT